MDDGSNDNSFRHVNGQGSFIPAGKAIEAVVVNLAARRDQTKVSKVSKHTEAMFQNSLRHLNAIEQANGHLIAAWKIYVAECETEAEARLKVGAALISITAQPVTKQE